MLFDRRAMGLSEAEAGPDVADQAKFPGGEVAYCSTRYHSQLIRRHTAKASRGWFEMQPAFYYDGNRGTRSDGKLIRFPEVEALRQFYQFAAKMDDFAQCILENRPTRVPGEDGLRDAKIMMAIYEAVKTGKTVERS